MTTRAETAFLYLSVAIILCAGLLSATLAIAQYCHAITWP